MFLKSFLIFIPFLSLFSCQDLKKKKQINEIVRSEKTIQQIQKNIQSQNNDAFVEILYRSKEVQSRIKQNYHSDTLNKDLGNQLNDYTFMIKKIDFSIKQYNHLVKEVEKEKTTLVNLKKDIETEAGDRSKYDEAIQFEEKKVKKLEQILDEIRKSQKESLETFHRLHSELATFANNLNIK
ncbi:MAG: hypothetical protein V4622_14000 [Bacteroidota bacterium]